MYALLLLGGNKGELYKSFEKAQQKINSLCGQIVWTGIQSQTQSWGYISCHQYLNQIVIIDTSLEPLVLLDCLESIEISLGRVDKGGSKWSEVDREYHDRTIDLDILYLFEEERFIEVSDERLVVPHPRIQERNFVKELLSKVDFHVFTRLSDIPIFLH